MSVKLTPTITMWTRREWGAAPISRPITQQSNPRHGFVHHTTDPFAEGVDTLAEMKACMRAIQRFHMVNRGYSDISYTYVVFQPYGNRDFARVFQGRLPHLIPAAQEGYNTSTIAIAVFGNFDHDDAVKKNTRHAIEVILNRHESLRTLGGHRDAPGQSTECPGDTMAANIDRMARATDLTRMRRGGLVGTAREHVMLPDREDVIL